MKIKALIYCCKNAPYLTKVWKGQYELSTLKEVVEQDTLNGKIVCECEVETEEIECVRCDLKEYLEYHYITKHLQEKDLIKRSCVDFPTMQNYLKLEIGYALHLTNVKERVMSLDKLNNLKGEIVRSAPQNMMWVWLLEKGKWVKYLLISIQPQWVCKILNHEKDIELRRKVLKGMCD